MIVQVVKEGKEHSQGIAYLTSVLQTPAGRMIFGKPKN